MIGLAVVAVAGLIAFQTIAAKGEVYRNAWVRSRGHVSRSSSKPGLRVYAGSDEIPRVFGGLGVAIVSTSRGVMSGAQARKMGIGGEVLCHVW